MSASFYLVYFVNGIAESAPRGGGGRGGGGAGSKGSNSSGSKRSGAYYLHGGLYPVSRTAKDTKAATKTPIHRGLGAWGIIGIVLGVLALCCGLYYALYLCDLSQRTANYTSNLAAQNPGLLTDKPKPEENGNSMPNAIPMTDKNDLSRGSIKNGLNEVFL